MSKIKDFAKKYLPAPAYKVAKICYNATGIAEFNYRIKIERTIKRAEKLLNYYKDELSKDILRDREYYFRTGDAEIFSQRMIKEGWTFFKPMIKNESGQYSEAFSKNYSGIVLLRDIDDTFIYKFCRMLAMTESTKNYRSVRLSEFLNGAEISDNEFVIPALSPEGSKLLLKYFQYHGRLKNFSNASAQDMNFLRTDEQYFDVFSPIENEIVVDAGCFDGDTAKRFLKWGGDRIKRVYTFELNPKNAEACEKDLAKFDKITLVKKGTWDKEDILFFSDGGAGSGVKYEGENKAYLTTIDNVVRDDKVTFIKMDVEGAELKSLVGARNTIIKNHPRLAICVYHKISDVYEIPEYILSIVPEYRFFLRHYNATHHWETVLYASCD